MTIKAITFDFWSTLYESKHTYYARRLQVLRAALERSCGTAVALEPFEAAAEVARQTWSRAWQEDHRTMTAGEWLDVVLGQLNLSLSPVDTPDIILNMENSVLSDLPAPVAGLAGVLASLAARYRLAIISDTGVTPGRVLRHILEQDYLAGYFSHFTFSDEVGFSKPHRAAFTTTLAALGVQPEEAVHVGDLLRTDVGGAQAVGMRAVQYTGLNPAQQSYYSAGPIPAIIPDAVIQSHAELEPLLQSWNSNGKLA